MKNLLKSVQFSFKFRVILFTLAIFMVSVLLFSTYLSQMLRKDMQQLLGDQQLATVRMVAQEINANFSDRLNALELVASGIDLSMMGKPATLLAYVEQRPLLTVLFNAGVFVVNKSGENIAETPPMGRIGMNFLDRDYVNTPLNEGKPLVGKAVIGKKMGVPLFSMGVPIRDAQGRVIGAFVGVTDLSVPNFLTGVNNSRYGNSGGFLILDPRNNLFVTATASGYYDRQVMRPLPSRQVNPLLYRRIEEGFDGPAVNVNSLGVEVLTSSARLPLPGWLLIASLPTAEALAPIGQAQARIVMSTFLMILTTGVLVWLYMTRLLRRQIEPMLIASNELDQLADVGAEHKLLPVTTHDEVGLLIESFNRLLTVLFSREKRLRTIFEQATDGIHILDTQGNLVQWSPSFATMLGYTPAELQKLSVRDWDAEFSPGELTEILAALRTTPRIFEVKNRRKDGAIIDVEINAKMVSIDGNEFLYCSARDITARKAAVEQIRKLSLAVEQSAESVVVTDLQGTIEYVNETFVKNTGYRREELIGESTRILESSKTSPETYKALWDSLHQGKTWRGEFYSRRKDGSAYIESVVISPLRDDAGNVTHYVATNEDATARKAAEEHTLHLAFYDQLTDLPNRLLLLERLGLALQKSGRSRSYAAMLYIDLDNFKNLNDTLGHEIGDELLKQLAAQLLSCVREGDTVARFGGDEFVVLLEGLSHDLPASAAISATIAKKVIDRVYAQTRIGNYDVRSSCSIGITLFSGHRADRVEDILKQADLAMYAAKTAGRNTYRLFDQAMQLTLNARAAVEADLRVALQEEQFRLFYQAQFNHLGQIVGSEALVRLNHPVRGVVAPGEFIQVAEQTGLIVPIGDWVLQTACEQLALWESDPDMAGLTVGVNVSARQFRDPDFVGKVLSILDHTGANPNRLKLEPTESILIENVEDAIAKMTILRSRGVHFALDDFGTGYSSLSYLKRLPLDQLKIDQSFIRDIPQDPNACSIVRAIVTLANSLDLSIIAEGVETVEQRDYLLNNGCNLYQGYLFSHPIPLERFNQLVKETLIQS